MRGRGELTDPFMNLECDVELEVIQRRQDGASRLCQEGAASAKGGGALEGAEHRRLYHRP